MKTTGSLDTSCGAVHENGRENSKFCQFIATRGREIWILFSFESQVLKQQGFSTTSSRYRIADDFDASCPSFVSRCMSEIKGNFSTLLTGRFRIL